MVIQLKQSNFQPMIEVTKKTLYTLKYNKNVSTKPQPCKIVLNDFCSLKLFIYIYHIRLKTCRAMCVCCLWKSCVFLYRFLYGQPNKVTEDFKLLDEAKLACATCVGLAKLFTCRHV